MKAKAILRQFPWPINRKRVIPIINITGNEQLTRVAVWLHHPFTVSKEGKPDRELLEHGCCKLLHQFFVAALKDADGAVVNYVGVQYEVNVPPISKIKDRVKKLPIDG